MPGMTVDKYVEAPPETVFEHATDLRRAPERISGIKRVEVLTEGPIRAGTRFRETRVMFKREATEEMEVIGFDPPKSFVVGCESHGCRYRSEFRFTPKGTGTLVTLEFNGTPLTFLTKVFAFLTAPMMKSVAKLCARDLEDLKVAAEKAVASRRA